MSIFAIGDLHLSFSVDKPMDIFGGWTDYVYRIKSNWEKVVEESDTVVIPGDISWAMSLQEAEEDFRFIHNLPGRKIILKGNHDYWWNTKKKMDAFLKEKGFDSIQILHNNAYKVGDFVICGSRGWFYDAQTGHDEKVIAREAARLDRSICEGGKLEGELIVFLHYPPVMQSEVCPEIMEVLTSHKIKRCYYGHLHGGSCLYARQGMVEDIDFSLISADFLEFCPRIIEKI